MKKKMLKFLIVLIPIVLIAVLVLSTCTAQVHTGYTGILTTFGRVEDRTLEAGFHFKSPFQKVVEMDNREQKSAFTTQAFSSDIQQVEIAGSINYAINPSTAMTLFKEVGIDYFNKLINPRLLENTKAVFSKYTAENLVSCREQLSREIKNNMVEEMKPYGIIIINISIENMDFSDAFTDAVEAKQVAAQKKLQAEIEQEQKTMESQQQAERQRIEAQAKAEVAKIDAEAEAYSTRVKSEAEANANKLIAESLTDELIAFNEIDRWDGQLPDFVAGDSSSTLPILNFNHED